MATLPPRRPTCEDNFITGYGEKAPVHVREGWEILVKLYGDVIYMRACEVLYTLYLSEGSLKLLSERSFFGRRYFWIIEPFLLECVDA